MARRKRYSAEFKREALRRADEPGVTDELVAEELGINAITKKLKAATACRTSITAAGR